MARATGRARGYGPVCTPLEMHVPVNYRIVGTHDWLRNAWEPGSWDQDQVLPVSDVNGMAPMLEFLNKIQMHGIDTETTGRIIKGDKNYSMNPVNPDTRMVLFQIGNEDLVYLLQPELVCHLKPWLESANFIHLLHNAVYDFKWLLVKYGIHMQRIYCSMLAEQLLVAGLMAMKVNLADVVRRHDPFWLINKAVRDSFITLDHERRKLTRDMAYYSGRDIVLMFPLIRDQARVLKEKLLIDIAQVEFDCIYATAEMEIEGFTMSLPVMRQIIEYWTQHEWDLAEEIFKLFGEEKELKGELIDSFIPELSSVFNLSSNAAKLAALREIDIDLDDIKRASLKDVTKNAIKGQDFSARQRAIAKGLGDISNAQKMNTTYGKNLIDKINATTKRIHPRFRQMGSGEEEGRKNGGEDKATVATGRFSSDSQVFPKPKELYALVRRPEELAFVMAQFGPTIAQLKAQHMLLLEEAA